MSECERGVEGESEGERGIGREGVSVCILVYAPSLLLMFLWYNIVSIHMVHRCRLVHGTTSSTVTNIAVFSRAFGNVADSEMLPENSDFFLGQQFFSGNISESAIPRMPLPSKDRTT